MSISQFLRANETRVKIFTLSYFVMLAFPAEGQSFPLTFPNVVNSSISETKIDLAVLELAKYCKPNSETADARAKSLRYKGFVPAVQYEGFQEAVFFVRDNPPRSVLLQETMINRGLLTGCGIAAGGSFSEFGFSNLLAAFEIGQTSLDNRIPVENGLPSNTKGWVLPLTENSISAIGAIVGKIDRQPISIVSVYQLTVNNN